MALARWQATITDSAGNVIDQPTIQVWREAPGSPPAQLFSDRDGLMPLSNPFTLAPGSAGYAFFHAVGSAYRIRASYGAFSKEWRYVGIGLATEGDTIPFFRIPFAVVRVILTSDVVIATDLEAGDVRNGVTLQEGDAVLLTAQTNGAENGIYVVPVSGAAARHEAFQTYDAHCGAYFSVCEGTTSGDTLWHCVSDFGGVLGTDALIFTEFVAGSGGASEDLTPYLGQVANAGRMPSSFDSVNKQLMSRVPMQARDHIKSLKLLFANFYVNGTTETGSGATAGIAASIEYPAGVFTQVLFSASASGSIPNNSTLLSDETIVDIPDGAEFWVRSWFTSTGGTLYNEKSNGDGNFSVSGGTNQTMSGTVVDDGNNYSYSPLAVLGTTRRRTVVLLGDSHVVGRDDTPDATRDLGSLQRSIGPYFGTIVLAKSGDGAAGYVASHTNRQAVIDTYATDLVCQLAHNDIYNNSRTPAQVQADVQTILGYAPDHVGRYVTTLQPKTSSTDDWATLGNMTVDAETTDAQTYNGLVRGGSIAGADGFFDICRAIESSVDSGKQKVTGVAFGYTVDGSHLNRAGQILIRDSGVVDAGLIRGMSKPRFATPGDVERGKAANLMVSPQSLMQGGLVDQGQVELTVGFSTPGDQSVAYTRRTGNWYRIADLVWINFRLTFTITYTTATGRLQVTGWPFEHADNNISGVVSFHNANANYDAGRTVLIPRFSTLPLPADVTLIFGMSGDNVATENFDIANLASGAQLDIMGTIIYKRGVRDVL